MESLRPSSVTTVPIRVHMVPSPEPSPALTGNTSGGLYLQLSFICWEWLHRPRKLVVSFRSDIYGPMRSLERVEKELSLVMDPWQPWEQSSRACTADGSWLSSGPVALTNLGSIREGDPCMDTSRRWLWVRRKLRASSAKRQWPQHCGEVQGWSGHSWGLWVLKEC